MKVLQLAVLAAALPGRQVHLNLARLKLALPGPDWLSPQCVLCLQA